MNLTKIVYYTIPALRHRENSLLSNLITWDVPAGAIHRFEGVDGKSPDVTKERLRAEMLAEGFPEFEDELPGSLGSKLLGDLVYHVNIRRVLSYILQQTTIDEAVLLMEDDFRLVRPWPHYLACVDSFPSTFEAIRFHCCADPNNLPPVPPACEFHPDFTDEFVGYGEHGLCLSHHGCRRLLEILKERKTMPVESFDVLSQFNACWTIRYSHLHPHGHLWIKDEVDASYRVETNALEVYR